jgi:hypothetical protein
VDLKCRVLLYENAGVVGLIGQTLSGSILLVEVRDKRHSVTLNQQDLESCAADHFDMSKPALNRYI